MPRQDVPYGGAICRLKERIAEIWDKLDQKLHSINGVEGDGAGNVDIVSGDAAITVSESPTGHYIEIGLDHGNLPSAAVSSVNGQTGAVRLDAKDILSYGDSNVQADVDENKAAINECFDGITSEQVARQNADATLQGNINSVQASIPGAAAAAVASDPTVAQLAADVPGKLDKISSGSTLKAYTHTGGAQGETAVVNGTDADSIGLRDANGRMQAADPAAGATDKTLVTANWVSQTGMTRPNNVLHGSGNEEISGVKSVVPGGRIEDLSSHVKNASGQKDYCPIYRMSGTELHVILTTLIRGGMAGIIKIDATQNSITKTIMLGTMDRKLGVFTDADGNRFLCCELLFNECISTMGMMGEAHSGFLGQIYAIVNDKSLGSNGLTQVAVTE